MRIFTPLKQLKGQAVVEFVLVAVFAFLPLAPVVIDLSHVMMTYHRMSAATREGAIAAARDIDKISAYPANCQTDPANPAMCSGDSACCDVLQKTRVILDSSNLFTPQLTGTWIRDTLGSAKIYFLKIGSSDSVRFLFKNFTINLHTEATGFAGPADPGEV